MPRPKSSYGYSDYKKSAKWRLDRRGTQDKLRTHETPVTLANQKSAVSIILSEETKENLKSLAVQNQLFYDDSVRALIAMFYQKSDGQNLKAFLPKDDNNEK